MSDEFIENISSSDKKLFVGLAGPGTGKSHTFKKIIQNEKFKGKNILILSFINKLVDDLAADFSHYSNVKVQTLHSFASGLMNNPELDPNLDRYISEDYKYINNTEINFEEKLRNNSLSKDEENFYKIRKELYKHTHPLYSFDSVIYALNSHFSIHPEKIPQYDLILVDEFQDFNELEVGLIKNLNSINKVVIVGDDDQSLYDFKKASPGLIREMYTDTNNMPFTLDYCYRCTEVIVNATNSLLDNATKQGWLQSRQEKKFLYPKDNPELVAKHRISAENNKIDFISKVSGHKLVYDLAKKIHDDIENDDMAEILILVPKYLKQILYEGLLGKGFNPIDFELFSEEKNNKIKHKDLVEVFNVLRVRKTDNLALRKAISLYLSESQTKDLIIKFGSGNNKSLWSLIDDVVKMGIENDIQLFKKVKAGKKKLSKDELLRFNKIFNLKNILPKLINGFSSIPKKGIDVVMTTTLSAKGLSSDYVYYLGIDDANLNDRNTNTFSDKYICEFLVGITRAKKKLTLISIKDPKPKILDFIDKTYINQIS